MEDLDNLLGGSFEEFSALNNFERTGFVLGCENWERYDFKALLRLVYYYTKTTFFANVRDACS